MTLPEKEQVVIETTTDLRGVKTVLLYRVLAHQYLAITKRRRKKEVRRRYFRPFAENILTVQMQIYWITEPVRITDTC